MSTYTTINYIPDLTALELQSARNLYFEPYQTNTVGWDFIAGVYGTNQYALLHDIYRFSAIEGATYDIFSTSYFDPFILIVYDYAGNAIVANSESDDGQDVFLGGAYYSRDIIFDWKAPYSGIFYVSASWDQGNYYTYYSLNIYEDRDTATRLNTAPVASSTTGSTN